MSIYHFPNKKPSQADWSIWHTLWASYTRPGFVLPTSLGPWIAPSHRIGEGYNNEESDSLFQRVDGSGQLYGHTTQPLGDHVWTKPSHR